MHFYAYIPSSFYHLILKLLGTFLIVSLCLCLCLWSLSVFVSLSLCVSYVSCIMAPKRKSTPSQNPLCSRASSSSSPFDLTPSHVRFCDEKAKSDFLENFSWRNIHSECQVILSDFFDTDLPMSSIVGVGNHFVVSRSRALPWSYRSSTPLCTDLITLYLSFLLVFGVYTW